MESLNCLMDQIYYQIFKVILNISKKHEERDDKPSIRMYVNKIENSITFRTRTWYHLKLLIPEMLKLFRSIKSQ